MGSKGRKNFPCSTVKAQTVKLIGARFCNRRRTSRRVRESLPPESATATRSPSRIILNRETASPTLRSSVFSRSKTYIIGNDWGGPCRKPALPVTARFGWGFRASGETEFQSQRSCQVRRRSQQRQSYQGASGQAATVNCRG